jgi:predicted nucleotidyltransferase
VRRYSAADRASVQSTLIDSFARDERVEGVLVVGSGAHGFADEYSDLDLAVIARAGEPALLALEWDARLESELPFVHRFGDDRGEAGYVIGLLLENFLEVDTGFLRIDQMAELGMLWAIAFDRAGAVERRQRSLEPALEDAEPAYRRIVDGIWHWITQVRVAIARGRVLLAGGSGRGPYGHSPRRPSGEGSAIARTSTGSRARFAIASRSLAPVVLQYLDQFERIA